MASRRNWFKTIDDSTGKEALAEACTVATPGVSQIIATDPTTGKLDASLYDSSSGTGTANCEGFAAIAHGFVVGDVLRFSSGAWVKAQSDTSANSEAIALVVDVADANNFTVCYSGRVDDLSGLTPDCVYFLDDTVAGGLTDIEPSGISKPILYATSATSAVLLIMRGIESDAASAPVYGSEYGYAENEPMTQTTSTTYIDKVTLVTPSLPAGDYRIGYQWKPGVSTNAINGEYQVLVGAAVVSNPTFEADTDNHQWGGFKKITLSGVQTIRIQYRSANGVAATQITNARIELWRVT